MRLRYLPAAVALLLCSCGSSSTTVVPTTPPPSAPTTGAANADTAYLPPWHFMSLSTAGIDTFLHAHPTYDGRGVVIVVFDTGVDPSIPGLLRTSTGAPKVIDMLDFSGSNVVDLVPATVQRSSTDTVAFAQDVPVRLHHLGALDDEEGKSGESAGRSIDDVYIGRIDESDYRNSSVRDFDGDGVSTSIFGVLLYRTPSGWQVVVDTDADSSMVGEKPVGSFSEHQQWFTFRQRQEGRSPITVAARIDSTAHRVTFVYDMNGHGTHVSGIAAGFGIDGEAGYNGVAPGAQIIGAKFSGDRYSDNTVTGSMRHAYDWAAALADSLATQNTPVVVNMSFGIGSSIEGRAAMETYLNGLIERHPNLYVVTAAGNEGPGLSTVGIPASASNLITVGALLPRGIGADSYGAVLGQDIIWDFSSRGGEVDKPDVLAPGTAVSTITRFAFDPKASGTSMASPYTTGVVALLLSAMRQEYPDWVPTQSVVRRALRYSARHLRNYAEVEQGGGVVNVRAAYDLLKRYHASGFADDALDYVISTYSPNYPDDRGPTAFWRSTYVPDGSWRQTFVVNRRQPTLDDDFFRAYTLEPTADWLRPIQSTVYIRGAAPASIDVVYDGAKLRTPGLYSARILARRASGTSAPDSDAVEFSLLNTIIVPYTFPPADGYAVHVASDSLGAGLTRRYYFAPPAGAAAIEFTLSVPHGSSSHVSGTVIDRHGYNAGYLPTVDGLERDQGSTLISTKDLGDGVVEVVVESDGFTGSGSGSRYSLDARAVMLEVATQVDSGGAHRGMHVTARSTAKQLVKGRFAYTVKGYARMLRDTLDGDRLRIPITMHAHDGALWITPTFSPEDYNKATDILVRLIDSSGFVQSEESFQKPSAQLFLPNFEGGETTYTLEIVFGAAATDPQSLSIPVSILEEHVHPSEDRSLGGFGSTDLVPYIPVRMDATLPEMEIPEGYHGIGEVIYHPGDDDEQVRFEFEIPR